MSRCSLSWDKRENGKETEQLSPNNQNVKENLKLKKNQRNNQDVWLLFVCISKVDLKKKSFCLFGVSPQDRRQDWEIKC